MRRDQYPAHSYRKGSGLPMALEWFPAQLLDELAHPPSNSSFVLVPVR
jgi:hypothetical protein